MVDGSSGPRGQRFEILLVDDDQVLVDLLAFIVEQAGFIPLVATEPAGAIELFEKEDPVVAVVDLNLRPWDGFELLAELRRRSPALPIIVLTARNSEDDKVRALDMGADDYVVKPFGHRELLARIRAHARRARGDQVHTPPILEVGSFRLDPGERTLYLDGVPTHLTGTEFRLLQYLMRHSDSVVPTAALARHVWGFNDAPARDVVRVTVHRLRRKLGDDGERQRFIHTVPGVGLRLRSG
ncbi:MAG: response regulator transcription factor [Chloroflexi bacterium]|nr:MAG: response regulator transcription factor [Chloroflexota bacterium]TME89296.1 MAG: response regulator transcription factor [Chloroflexota bacterium]